MGTTDLGPALGRVGLCDYWFIVRRSWKSQKLNEFLRMTEPVNSRVGLKTVVMFILCKTWAFSCID